MADTDSRLGNPPAQKVDFSFRAVAAEETTEKQSTQMFCLATAQLGPKYSPIGERYPSRYLYALIKSNLPETEITRQWTEFVGSQVVDAGTCSLRSESDIKYAIEHGSYMYGHKFEQLAFVPKETVEPKPSKLLRKTVSFRSPKDNEEGFSGVVFDVEYLFLTCMGELHIAYSLVEDSVGVGRLAGGGDRVVTNGGPGRANYWHQGIVYKVGALPETILNLPLKGTVWMGFQDTPIGTFADDHAGRALGFGCFSGQTKKVADLKDLKTAGAKEPMKEELAKLFDRLRVSFETVQVLTSSAAEQEIKSGNAKAAADEHERSGQAGLDRAAEVRAAKRKAAEERDARRAAEEAEFQSKQKAYEEGLAAHDAAVEQYQKALADAEAQKAAGVAQAKAAQQEFARKQAEYEAEAARAKRAQEEYEAKYGRPQ